MGKGSLDSEDHGLSPHWLSFVAEGRSGHTLLAALLDAHPCIRISEEQNLVRKGLHGEMNREQIISKVHESRWGKEKKRFRHNRLGEMINRPGNPTVLGDKYGWECRKLPVTLYEDFGQRFDFRPKIIAMVRDPYAHVSSWCVSSKYKRVWGPRLEDRLRLGIRRLARFYTKAQQVADRHDILILSLEELVYAPRDTLIKAAMYLEVEPDSEWLRTAPEFVWSKPRIKECDWPDRYVEMVQWRLIDRFPLLERYREA